MKTKPKPTKPKTPKALKPRIIAYAVTKNGLPTKRTPQFEHAPYGIVPPTLRACKSWEQGDAFTYDYAATDPKIRERDRKAAKRQASAYIRRTQLTIERLQDSIHYDSHFTKLLGDPGTFAIIPIHAQPSEQ